MNQRFEHDSKDDRGNVRQQAANRCSNSKMRSKYCDSSALWSRFDQGVINFRLQHEVVEHVDAALRSVRRESFQRDDTSHDVTITRTRIFHAPTKTHDKDTTLEELTERELEQVFGQADYVDDRSDREGEEHIRTR